ncbi:non-specific serine/threonine protein kinase [Trifolium repens]|nr:non-specific serine/threonine protein kinase [Trifolium repens]
MEFIGKDGWGAPRLKDANLSLEKLRKGYAEIIVAMRVLYQKCSLVLGDLSECNILYYTGHLYIIDVSQAVDPDHPCALEFLIEDCIHVSVQQNILDRGEVSIDDEIADRTFAKDYIAKKLVDVKIMSGKDILDLYYHMIPGLEQHKHCKYYRKYYNAESQSDEDEDNVSDSKEISSY